MASGPASGSSERLRSITLRFKRSDQRLTSHGCDVSLKAPLSEPVRGVLQAYGVWEWHRLHDDTERTTEPGSAVGPQGASNAAVRTGGSQSVLSERDSILGEGCNEKDPLGGSVPGDGDEGGRGTRPAGAQENDAGSDHATEHAAAEDVTRHWESLNFYPVRNVRLTALLPLW